MENTPIEDETADILISNCVINLAPDKGAVFREAYRVLKPGGRLMVSDMVLVEELSDEQKADRLSRDDWVACLAGAELKPVYLGNIANAGFTDIEVASETHVENGEGWRSKVRSMDIRATKPDG
jgi:SAM-dependent methyltransferase